MAKMSADEREEEMVRQREAINRSRNYRRRVFDDKHAATRVKQKKFTRHYVQRHSQLKETDAMMHFDAVSAEQERVQQESEREELGMLEHNMAELMRQRAQKRAEDEKLASQVTERAQRAAGMEHMKSIFAKKKRLESLNTQEWLQFEARKAERERHQIAQRAKLADEQSAAASAEKRAEERIKALQKSTRPAL
eukprot:NODE_5945_length_667_cov_44.353704_g5922_i0.p2 GENE.NODE_5945_length_667_cov_44.353704_g5922_i0~~NODE_5945_length_667_cov_44.353704_g5922_i0.p2  ORF type:complete len:208 (+),score=68.90 NODE_5945_length_667_cov_44.353704_g5922_i0:44-625(+)